MVTTGIKLRNSYTIMIVHEDGSWVLLPCRDKEVIVVRDQ